MNKLPQRKQLRLKEYDYSQNGYYYITICTKDRKQILSKIIDKKTNIDNKKIEYKTVGVATYGRPANKINQRRKNCKKTYRKLQ